MLVMWLLQDSPCPTLIEDSLPGPNLACIDRLASKCSFDDYKLYSYDSRCPVKERKGEKSRTAHDLTTS